MSSNAALSMITLLVLSGCWNEPTPSISSSKRRAAPSVVEKSSPPERRRTTQELSKLLFQAISQNDRETINQVLDANPNLVNQPRENNDLPLVFAAAADDVRPEIVKLLLVHGADPDKKQVSYRFPLDAVFSITDSSIGRNMNVQVEKFKILYPVTKLKIDIHEMIKEFFHHIATSRTQYKVSGQNFFAYILLKNLMSVNEKVDDSGTTLLIEAAKARHPKLVEYLVGKGADIELTDNDGKTALVRGLSTTPSIYDSVDDYTSWRCDEYGATGQSLLKIYKGSIDNEKGKILIASLLDLPDALDNCFTQIYDLVSMIKSNFVKEDLSDLADKAQSLLQPTKKAKAKKIARLLAGAKYL